MQNSNSKLNTILSLILIIVLIVGFWMVVHTDKPVIIDESWKDSPLDTTPGFPNGGGGDISTEKQNQIRSLFDGLMKKQGGFSEYVINSINQVVVKSEVSKEDEDFYFPIPVTEDAYVASVNFSVQASDTKTMEFWKAGNGYTESDDSLWTREKVLLLTIDKVNGEYTIVNSGTGF
jgi:hypothetical protein